MIQKDHKAKFVLCFFTKTLLVDYQEISILVKNHDMNFALWSFWKWQNAWWSVT